MFSLKAPQLSETLEASRGIVGVKMSTCRLPVPAGCVVSPRNKARAECVLTLTLTQTWVCLISLHLGHVSMMYNIHHSTKAKLTSWVCGHRLPKHTLRCIYVIFVVVLLIFSIILLSELSFFVQ